MANGNGQRGVVITWAIFVVLAGATGALFKLAWDAGGAIEKVDGRVATNKTAIGTAVTFIEAVKKDGTDICRKAQLSAVEVGTQVKNMDRRLTEVQTDVRALEESIRKQQGEYRVQQEVILAEIRKRNNE